MAQGNSCCSARSALIGGATNLRTSFRVACLHVNVTGGFRAHYIEEAAPAVYLRLVRLSAAFRTCAKPIELEVTR